MDFFILEKGGVCRGPGPGSQKKGALLNLRDAEEGPLELGFILGGERVGLEEEWIKQDLSVVLQCCKDPVTRKTPGTGKVAWWVKHCHAGLRTRVQIPAIMEMSGWMRQREGSLE